MDIKKQICILSKEKDETLFRRAFVYLTGDNNMVYDKKFPAKRSIKVHRGGKTFIRQIENKRNRLEFSAFWTECRKSVPVVDESEKFRTCTLAEHMYLVIEAYNIKFPFSRKVNWAAYLQSDNPTAEVFWVKRGNGKLRTSYGSKKYPATEVLRELCEKPFNFALPTEMLGFYHP